jgi:hypothetical protein
MNPEESAFGFSNMEIAGVLLGGTVGGVGSRKNGERNCRPEV